MLKQSQPNYRAFAPISLPDRTGPDAVLTPAPIWLCGDRLGGNQMLIEPMDLHRKPRMFEMLVEIGFGLAEGHRIGPELPQPSIGATARRGRLGFALSLHGFIATSVRREPLARLRHHGRCADRAYDSFRSSGARAWPTS